MLTFGASLDPNYTGTDGLIMISKMCRDRAKFHVLDDERDRLLAPTTFSRRLQSHAKNRILIAKLYRTQNRTQPYIKWTITTTVVARWPIVSVVKAKHSFYHIPSYTYPLPGNCAKFLRKSFRAINKCMDTQTYQDTHWLETRAQATNAYSPMIMMIGRPGLNGF